MRSAWLKASTRRQHHLSALDEVVFFDGSIADAVGLDVANEEDLAGRGGEENPGRVTSSIPDDSQSPRSAAFVAERGVRVRLVVPGGRAVRSIAAIRVRASRWRGSVPIWT